MRNYLSDRKAKVAHLFYGLIRRVQKLPNISLWIDSGAISGWISWIFDAVKFLFFGFNYPGPAEAIDETGVNKPT